MTVVGFYVRLISSSSLPLPLFLRLPPEKRKQLEHLQRGSQIRIGSSMGLRYLPKQERKKEGKIQRREGNKGEGRTWPSPSKPFTQACTRTTSPPGVRKSYQTQTNSKKNPISSLPHLLQRQATGSIISLGAILSSLHIRLKMSSAFNTLWSLLITFSLCHLA